MQLKRTFFPTSRLSQSGSGILELTLGDSIITHGLPMASLRASPLLNSNTRQFNPLKSFHTSKNLQKDKDVSYKQTSGKNSGIVIRNMSKSDLHIVIDWANHENWNFGKYEVEPLMAADPHGYFVLEDNGKLVASLSAVKYSQAFSFLGLYIVKQEYRNQGFGIPLWNVGMDYLKDNNCIGLNAVLEQVNNYQKYGFIPAHLNTRWRGVPNIENKKAISNIYPVTNITSRKKLLDYDATIFTIERRNFLDKWLDMPSANVLAYVVKNQIKGYGVISACQNGYKVAPLFADSSDIAEVLFTGLCESIGKNELIQLDTPHSNLSATKLVEKFGLFKTSNNMRMYRGNPPTIDHNKTYGLTSLEIG